jgi:hypothetical protein
MIYIFILSKNAEQPWRISVDDFQRKVKKAGQKAAA